MKKWLLFFVVMLLLVTKVSAEESSDIYKLSVTSTTAINLKDPQIIKITHTEPVDKKLYNQKISNEQKQHSAYKKQIGDDYYVLYKVFEKLIRANNLYYQNWRLMLEPDAAEINAYATSANLVIINTSLYDSLYDNENALAFILGHEIGHFVLGHHQTTYENLTKIHELEVSLVNAGYNVSNQQTMSQINSAFGYNYAALGNQLSSTAYFASIVAINNTINKLYEQERKLEYEADSEAVTLMARAGYNLDESLEALDLIARLPNTYTKKSTHPPTADRIRNMNEVIKISDIDELRNEGERNIYNSGVLSVKKSSDKKSVVISKFADNNKVSYSPKTKKDKMLEIAYKSYLNRDMKASERHFTEVFNKYPTDYIAPLYLSYIYEYNFFTDKDKKTLKTAAHWAKIAGKLNPADRNVSKQKADIAADFKSLKTK